MSVSVGGPHADPAQVKQVPGVRKLVPAARVVHNLEVWDAAKARAGSEAQHCAVMGSNQEKSGQYKQCHGFEIF